MPTKDRQRICIVDDDAAVRDSLQILLDAHGFEVESFSSAAAFLGVPCDYRCVVVDHCMPVTSGLELLELLRMSSIQTPAILMIDKGEPALVPRIEKAGGCTALRKPITEFDLIRTVSAACGADAI